jgi:hypothetical protein
MVELTKSEELDVAGKAAFCLACHALDSPVGSSAFSPAPAHLLAFVASRIASASFYFPRHCCDRGFAYLKMLAVMVC